VHLIGVEMMMVVEQAPTMEGVNQRQHEKVADPIVHPALFRKGTVTTVVGNYKPTGQGCPGKKPGNRE
jgi:hypothetical protein